MKTTKRNKITRKVKSGRQSIYGEFCQEIDLFNNSQPFPDWVFDFRERLLTSTPSKLIKFCRKLKSAGVKFHILCPININDKWEFADVYIPSRRVVVMVNTQPHPAGWLSQRAQFFTGLCKVYELDGYESDEYISSLIDKLRMRCV